MELKKQIVFFAFLFVFIANAISQCQTINLIKNPSLEEYTCCPKNMTMISCANDWTQPLTESTSDYFNTCAIDSLEYPPIKPAYLHSFFGNGYAGILCDHFTDPFIYREYIQGTLTDPLIANKCYYLEFWTLLSGLFSSHAFDALGVYLSDTLPKYSIYADPLYFPAQVNNPIGNVISDTTNWTKISGTFVASGGEKFITIGTFKHENEINKIQIKPFEPGTDYSCYYFDNFSLCPCGDTIPIADTIKPLKPVLEVYPNPAKDDLFILFDDYEQLSSINLEIYNILGELVMNEQINSSPIASKINIGKLAGGCYVVVLKNRSRSLYKGRLVVIR